MSVVLGNIRYISHYNSLEELIQDPNVYDGKIVNVKDGEAFYIYQIATYPSYPYYLLDNGLYANRVKIGNDSSGTSDIRYTSSGPSDYNVGGVQLGETFNNVPVTSVLDKIFNGEEIIKATMMDGASEHEYYRKGSELGINGVTVIVEKTQYPIVLIEVFFNDVLKMTYPTRSYTGNIPVLFPSTIYIDTDTTVSCRLTDDQGNQCIISETHHFIDFVYAKVVSSGDYPGVEMFGDDNKYLPGEDFSIKDTYTSERLVFAIPDGYELVALYDENMLNCTSIIERGPVELPYHPGNYLINYYFYYCKGITIKNYTFTIETKKKGGSTI